MRQDGKGSAEPAIATTTAIPVAALKAVRAAAARKKSLVGGTKDSFPMALARHGRALEVFEHSGQVLGTVFVFLDKKRGIDLRHSRHDEVASEITRARGSSFFILGEEHLPLVAEGILRQAGERGRAIRMAVAVFLTLLAPGIIRSGLFLPIPRVSAGIR